MFKFKFRLKPKLILMATLVATAHSIFYEGLYFNNQLMRVHNEDCITNEESLENFNVFSTTEPRFTPPFVCQKVTKDMQPIIGVDLGGEFEISEILLLNYKYSDSINGANLIAGTNLDELEKNEVVAANLQRETFDGRYKLNRRVRFIGIHQPNSQGKVKELIFSNLSFYTYKRLPVENYF